MRAAAFWRQKMGNLVTNGSFSRLNSVVVVFTVLALIVFSGLQGVGGLCLSGLFTSG